MYKTRASQIGSIMTNPKSKTESLSQTAKDAVLNQWIKDKFNREKEINSLPIKKGILNEEMGITMLSLHLNDMLLKNQEKKENDFITGTCDIIHDDIVYDIKCSYDLWTFAKANISKDYYWQLQGYMWLWNLKKARLVYVLTDAPDSVLDAEVRSAVWRLDGNDVDIIEVQKQISNQLTYQDIPNEIKIKFFDVDYNESDIDEIKNRIQLCREYYDSLKL